MAGFLRTSFVVILLLTAQTGATETVRSCNAWTEFASPSGGGTLEVLYDVAALPSGLAWAVGVGGTNNASMIQRFNGTEWAIDYLAPGGYLRSVVAFAANDVWAVGGDESPVVLRFDGASWASVPRWLLLEPGVVSSSDGYARRGGRARLG